MDNIQLIGKRTSILRKDKTFSLVILPTDAKKKTNVLFLWLLAWSVSGVIIIANYFTLTSDKSKMMIIVWLAFWAYFEFKIVRVFMWKRFGQEKLWIKNGRMFFQQSVNGKGKIKEYDLNLVADWKLIELESTSFSDNFNQSFWVKGGERIQFTYQGKEIKFGFQLSDEDTKSIIKEIKAFL